MLSRKHFATAYIIFLLISAPAIAQKGAEISSETPTFDFGSIIEDNGLATHAFTVKNTGINPLVITRITASCGCTQPQWDKTPIPAGATTEVTISYNPKGRPGPFYKSIAIISNAKNGRLTLYIKGNVTGRTLTQPTITYPYNIGELKLQAKNILYNRLYPGQTQEETIPIRNDSKEPLQLHTDKTPNYLTVEINPPTLKPGETGEISILFLTDQVKQMGHITTTFPLIVQSDGKQKTESNLTITANIIDNFSRWTTTQKAKAPAAQFSHTHIDFGKLPDKTPSLISIIGGGNRTQTLTLTNTGQTTLQIYSISSDNPAIDITGSKKELKPAATATYKINLRPKEIKTKLEAYINIVCNDPTGPVRLIKVTAEK